MVLKQAIILAGGQGKRLRPFTLTNNKCMYPINGKPFIWHLIKLLKKNDIKEVLILTGWKAKKVQVKFPGVKISYHYTPFKIKGKEIQSSIRIKNALELLNDKFLLMYCDNWWPFDLKKIYKTPSNITYKGKDLGFFVVSKELINDFYPLNIPIQEFLKPLCFSYDTNKQYYSISDPIRAEETAKFLKHEM